MDLSDAALRERIKNLLCIHGHRNYVCCRQPDLEVWVRADCDLRDAAREEEAAQSREALAVMGLNYDNAVAEGKANVQRAVDAARAEADCGCSREVTHGDSCPAWCHIRVQIQEARAEQREANLEIIQHGLEHCAAQGRELTPRNVIAAILTAIRSQR